MKIKIILFLSLMFIFSCHETQVDPSIHTPKTGTEVFEMFHQGMIRNYVFWDIDTTDWNLIQSKYRPLFGALDITNDTDVMKSVEYFKEITAHVIDGHFSITYQHPAVKNRVEIPSYTRKQSQPDFHPAYSYALLASKYLDANFISGYDSLLFPSKLPFALSGTINGNIVYFHCSEFSLSRATHSTQPNGVKEVFMYFRNQLKNESSNWKSIIIDLRGNPGGDLADLNLLMELLADHSFTFGASRYRNGSDPANLTSWISATIHAPTMTSVKRQVPIIVLADNFTASLAELVTMAIAAMPNGMVIGENTWGANGVLTANELFNAGSFEIPGYMTVQASSSQFRYIDGKIYEGLGFPPDIAIAYNSDAINNNRDTALEKAIDLIR